MKYMVLINANREAFADMARWSHDDVKVMVSYMGRLNQELIDNGELVDGNGLGGPTHMKTVRARADGDPLVTDGPFPESKEVLAGYWVVDVASEARAIEIAARASAAPGAGGKPSNDPIEVHPVQAAPDAA